MTATSEIYWNQLLDFIDAGTVVPVLGRELLRTEIGGRQQDIYSYLASRLAIELGVEPPQADTPGDPVSQVAHRYLATRQDPAWPYAVVFRLVKQLAGVEPPSALRKLAEIGFPLLISTTFEGFLERAFETLNAGTTPKIRVKSYFLNSDTDLDPYDDGDRTVFNLLGRACPTPDYALTDADVLEFVRQFHRGNPPRLLDTLSQRHLLVIGSGFSDWLARFFLRMARPANFRLWMNAQGLTHYIANDRAGEDSLLQYLQHPLSASHVFLENDPARFVDELHQRWRERNPGTVSRIISAVTRSNAAPDRGVFLSYARADSEVAGTIRDRLDKSGLDVWFDKSELHAGDDWDRRIRRALDKSTLFVPLISENTLTDAPDRYFRAEWRFAEARAQRAPFNVPYIFPLVIDQTNPHSMHEHVPDLFTRGQWTVAPNGAVPDEFVVRLKDAYRKLQRPEAARA